MASSSPAPRIGAARARSSCSFPSDTSLATAAPAAADFSAGTLALHPPSSWARLLTEISSGLSTPPVGRSLGAGRGRCRSGRSHRRRTSSLRSSDMGFNAASIRPLARLCPRAVQCTRDAAQRDGARRVRGAAGGSLTLPAGVLPGASRTVIRAMAPRAALSSGNHILLCCEVIMSLMRIVSNLTALALLHSPSFFDPSPFQNCPPWPTRHASSSGSLFSPTCCRRLWILTRWLLQLACLCTPSCSERGSRCSSHGPPCCCRGCHEAPAEARRWCV